jgi:hypothetical protein
LVVQSLLPGLLPLLPPRNFASGITDREKSAIVTPGNARDRLSVEINWLNCVDSGAPGLISRMVRDTKIDRPGLIAAGKETVRAVPVEAGHRAVGLRFHPLGHEDSEGGHRWAIYNGHRVVLKSAAFSIAWEKCDEQALEDSFVESETRQGLATSYLLFRIDVSDLN